MKILVLGAGATGGYFAGRLAQQGADVTFLVRERRAAQLAANGLVVRSPHGDFTVRVKFVQQAELRPGYDLVMLACKAYDLDSGIDAIRAAMGAGVGAAAHVMPLLNGIAHIDRLIAEFGAQRVIGGTCGIPATLTADGEVRQLGPLHRIAYGMLPGTSADARVKLEALHALYQRTPVDAVLADDITQELWEKFVLLATMAAMTSLMRGSVGDIMAAGEGEALMAETLQACALTAARSGHPVRDKPMATFREILFARGSALSASMLRDIEGGRCVEAQHVVGDMLERARAAGVDPGPLRAAYAHLQAYQARRGRESRA
ncbi:MAG: ketopantoate reductase family protein [Burkholderiales bacterium]|nr:ketopantoate reductase family protein [Burkholderiales bacterium]